VKLVDTSDSNPYRLILFIPGIPRPKYLKTSFRGRLYDPQKAHRRTYTALASIALRDAFCTEDLPFRDAISLKVTFLMPIPKSFSKKKKDFLQGRPHIKRPDLSNLQKFFEDALTPILWPDDCLIHTVVSSKIYSGTVGTVIKVKRAVSFGLF